MAEVISKSCVIRGTLRKNFITIKSQVVHHASKITSKKQTIVLAQRYVCMCVLLQQF